MKIKRLIQDAIEKKLFKGKCIILYGARRVGKTTLVQDLLSKYAPEGLYLNCDEPDIREALRDKSSTQLKHFIGNQQFVVIDEAQRVHNIGLTLKLITDQYPDIQVIATGSSSFDLANSISEPLTGRTYEFQLYPFSTEELLQIYTPIEFQRLLDHFLRFGMYPEVIISPEPKDSEDIISTITQQYLYKDILEFERLKNPELLQKLLQALALQVGNEVSYQELANLLQVNKVTIERYIGILEKSFVIFRLPPFSRTPRREINKMRKIYFTDCGVRNSLIKNTNELSLRTDVGALWENFCIAERMKMNSIHEKKVSSYFWRTYRGNEIDYLEEHDGRLSAFEFKWKPQKAKISKEFFTLHPAASGQIITRENGLDFFSPSFKKNN